MTKEAEHAIEVEKLTKRYGELLAVNDISFTVRKGEVFAFLGANGAGKTTTVEIIETIRTPTSGKVSLLGMDVTKKEARHCPPHRRPAAGVQLVRQDNGQGDHPVLLAAFLLQEHRYRRADRAREPQGQDQRAVQEPLRGLEAAPRNRDCARERPRSRVPRRADDRARPPRKARGVGSPAGSEEQGEDGISHHALHGGSGASCRHGSPSSRRGRSSRWTLPASS